MATTEGWIEVMNSGIDSVDIGMQPQEGRNIYWSFFFMLFIVFANFLILNLFIGVVISTFNKEKELLGKNFLLTDNQKKWLEQKKMVINIHPKLHQDKFENRTREAVRQLVLSKQFKMFIIYAIIVNTLFLTINWYDEPESLS